MAVRLDLFSATSRDAFSGADPEALVLLAESGAAIADPTWLGFLAASDADEDELTALLAACGEAGAVAGAMNQGLGLDDSAETTAAACATVGTASPLARTWLDVIGWAAETAAARDRSLAWLTRYDLAGSRDAGSQEWQTSWSDAPTEGIGADTPWPAAGTDPENG